MTFQAVVFDLWDTLVPLPKALRDRAFDALARALGAPHDALREACSATRIERETGELEPVARRICRDLGLDLNDEALSSALLARTSIHGEAFAGIRPDAVPALQALRKAGLLIGLISNCTSDLPSAVEEVASGSATRCRGLLIQRARDEA